MARNSAVNLDINVVGTDGFVLAGGSTKRSLTITGGNTTLTGSAAVNVTINGGTSSVQMIDDQNAQSISGVKTFNSYQQFL